MTTEYIIGALMLVILVDRRVGLLLPTETRALIILKPPSCESLIAELAMYGR